MMKPRFTSLSDLLPKAVNRAGISREILAVQIVEEASRLLSSLLPPHAVQDIRVCFYKDGFLYLQCRNSSASQCLIPYRSDIFKKLKQLFPHAELYDFRMRIEA